MKDFSIGVGGDFSELMEGFKKLPAEAQKAGEAIGEGLGEGIDETRKRIGAILKELKTLKAARAKLSVDSSEYKQAEQQAVALRKELGDLMRKKVAVKVDSTDITKAGQESKRLRDVLSTNIGGGIFGQLAGLASAGSIVAFLKGSIDEAVKLETITRKLSNTLGNQGAAGALSFTRKLSDELGLSFNTLSNTFGGFTAAATAAGVPINQQKDLFAAVSKSAQSLGLSNDELSGSLLALQQVASKGTVQMEELRGQLGERLPVAFGATAKGLGLTQQELIKLVESGGLGAERFFLGLTKGLNELNSDAGGVPTAAQNFAKLENAWVDLQAGLGTSLLPAVTETVKQLALALEGLKVENTARDLRQSFGVTADEATQLVGTIKTLQEQYALTNQQAKNLLSNAIANAGASRDWFGELNLGGKQFAQIQLGLVDLAKQFRDANPDLAAQKRQEAIEMQRVQAEQKKALDLENARKASAVELARVYAEAQVKGLQSQIEVGQQLAGLTRTIGDVEQSRFSVTRSALQFELQKLEERGAGEFAIAAKKAEIDRLDRNALTAKYQALQQQQQLEIALLDLSQQKARIEAQSAIDDLRSKRAEAELSLARAATSVEKEKLGTVLQTIDVQINSSQQRLSLLAQTQPIERASAAATAEIARNNLQAEAASKGLQIATNGALVPLRDAAAAISDGSTAADETQKALAAATAPSGAIAEAFVKTGKNAPAAVQGARDFAAHISRAKQFTAETIKLGLDGHMVAVRDATGDAAQQAKVFYDWLSKAAALPAARWSGGPVEAGSDYRINELGQEALLSAGRLSLINAPQNAIWRAPSTGVVVPAGITARLQAAGALPSPGSIATTAGTAELAVEIGKLRQEVGELARRQWNINVTQRTGTSGSQVLRTLQQLR